MGQVTGSVKWILRAEGAAIFAVAVLVYSSQELSWRNFLLLFLLPDLAFFGYFINSKIGAYLYNCSHTLIPYVALLITGLVIDHSLLLTLGLIGIAHVGFDRALGYGLKYPTGFGDTHLGRIGRNPSTENTTDDSGNHPPTQN